MSWKSNRQFITKVVKDQFDMLWHVHYIIGDGARQRETYDRVSENDALLVARNMGKWRDKKMEEKPENLYAKRIKGKVFHLCGYHSESLGWDACSDGSCGCQVGKARRHAKKAVKPFKPVEEFPEGADICSKCGDVGPAGSMRDVNEVDFDLLCDKCLEKGKKVKTHDIKFRVGGAITWVSKSGKKEDLRHIPKGTVVENVRLVKSNTKGAYDLKDGNWTVFGLDEKAFKIIR